MILISYQVIQSYLKDELLKLAASPDADIDGSILLNTQPPEPSLSAVADQLLIFNLRVPGVRRRSGRTLGTLLHAGIQAASDSGDRFLRRPYQPILTRYQVISIYQGTPMYRA